LHKCLLLGECVVAVAVISWLWVWDTSGLSISKSESFIKVWAMFENLGIIMDFLEVLTIRSLDP